MALYSLLGVGFATIAAVSIAVQSLAVRIGTRTRSVVEVIGVMFLVNLLVLGPVAGVAAYPAYELTVTALVAFGLAGVLGSLIARVCYFIGIVRLGASRAEPLKALLPLFAVIAAVVVLDERVTLILGFGITLLLLGGIAVTLESQTSPTTPTGRDHWVAVSFPLAAALLLGIDPVFTKLGLAEGTSALVGVTIRISAAAAGFGVYLLWRTIGNGRRPSIRPNRWLLMAAVANTAYLASYYAALARAPVTVVMPILGSSTLFVVGGAAVFLQADERVTWRLTAAALLVVLGVVLIAAS